MSIKTLRSMVTACCTRPAMALLALCLLAVPALAQTPGPVVISQVYGNGNASGSTYLHDYIELFNRSCVPVDVSTWSIQQAASTGTTWAKTNLPSGAIIPPGGYYLVQFTRLTTGTPATGSLPLPVVPDAYAQMGSAGSAIDIGATSGKFLLVRNQTTVPAVTCPNSTFANGVVDSVTYGTGGNGCEGTVIPTLTANRSILRAGNGCTDTNVNNADFTQQVANVVAPRNSLTPSNFCNLPGFGSCTIAATGACTILNAADCTTAGGVYADCEPCPGRGACCLSTGCVITNVAECGIQGGSYAGVSTTCYTKAVGTNAIETLASPTTGPTGDDAASSVITLPFTFVYFGQPKTQIWYNTNGLVGFGSSTSTGFTNLRAPNDATPNDVFYALWDDQNIDASASTQHAVVGTTPGSRKFVITWNNNLDRSTGGPRHTYQVVIYENTNQIEFRYGTFAQELWGGDYDIGLENSTGLVGQYVLSRDITSNSSITWTPACTGATGACCNGNTCNTLSAVSCANALGTFLGTTSTCLPTNPCVTGACCKTDGTCDPAAFQTACVAGGGLYQGDGVPCPSNCPALGACCTGATCAPTFQVNCASGVWYSSTACSSNPCTGSCCVASSGACSVVAGAAACVGGTYTQSATCGGTTYTAGAFGTNAIEDISADAGATQLTTGDDVNSPSIPLPFAFSFFGVPKSNMIVNSNGWLTFDTSAATTGMSTSAMRTPVVPLGAAAGVPNDFIAGVWRDLNQSTTTSPVGKISYETLGTPPFRRFVTLWKDIVNFNTTNFNTFEVILYETSNCVEIRWGAIQTTTTDATFGAGLENAAGTGGSNVPASTIVSNTSKLFCPTGLTCPQPTGACCNSTTCVDRSYADCQAAGGIWYGYSVSCQTSSPCVPTGGCCSATGGCSTTIQTTCEGTPGSVYNGDNVACTTGVNCVTGNCCTAAGVCNLKTAAGCALAPAGYFSAGTCTGTPCPTGACCSTAGNCTVVVSAACPIGSSFFRWTAAASCSPNLCVGRCCLGDGTCSTATSAACQASGGSYATDGSTCAGVPAGSPQTFAQTSGLPLAIPDNNINLAVTSTINVVPSFVVGKATVTVAIPAHTFVGDLLIKITHGTTTVVLWGNSCSSFDNLTATFDDSAVGTYVCANGPQGTIKTQGTGAGLLSSFVGQNSDGAWTLFAGDTGNGDTGSITAWSVTLDGAINPCQGACCSSVGSCTYTGPANCPGGDFRGVLSVCTPNPCVPQGRCCTSTGGCSTGDQASCVATAGNTWDLGVTCSTPCVTGRCCTAAGVCDIRTAYGCQTLGGYYAGDTTTCTSDPCPVGACCADSGSCSVVIGAACPIGSGFFRWTAAGSCLPNLCVGRCCDAAGTCSVVVQTACSGQYGGDGTNCTSTTTYPQTSGLPLSIPDNNTTGVTSDLTVAATGNITGVQVSLSVPGHTYIGDLFITITHGSTTVVLWNNSCSSADNLTANFSDAGSTVSCVNGPQGTIKPTASDVLAAFNGASAGGLWTLFAKDTANQDFGDLVSWSVTLSTDAPPCQGACCDSFGVCTLTGSGNCAGSFGGIGTSCTPNPCVQPQTGSCCQSDGSCLAATPGNPLGSNVAVCSTGVLAVGGVCTPNTCTQPQTGSCCQFDGTCVPATPGNAIGVNVATCSTGSLTVGGVCTPNTCTLPQTGSCCQSDGTCIPATPGNAIGVNVATCATGSLNVGGVCSPNTCTQPQVGICCQSTGACTIATPGNAIGSNTATCSTGSLVVNGTCTPNTCLQPQVGICCQSTGACTIATPGDALASNTASCSTGALTVNGTCSPNTCGQPQTGKCCHSDGSCVAATPGDPLGSNTATCASGALTVNGTCTPNTCVQPQVGVCCGADGTCSTATPGDALGSNTATCATGTLVVSGTCTPNTCPQPTGACCTSTSCTIVTLADCQSAGGAYQGNNTTCPSAPTSVAAAPATVCAGQAVDLTASVLAGQTVVWHEGSCAGTIVGSGSPTTVHPLVNTTYYAQTVDGVCVSDCVPVSVVANPATGACCTDYGATKVCTVVLATACAGPNSPTQAYRGDCTACGPTSCCPADYNNNGQLELADIFAYIDDWFHGATSADFNHSGGLQIQDIFDYLTRWFAGC